jgi:hypothetical protein
MEDARPLRNPAPRPVRPLQGTGPRITFRPMLAHTLAYLPTSPANSNGMGEA